MSNGGMSCGVQIVAPVYWFWMDGHTDARYYEVPTSYAGGQWGNWKAI